MEGRQLGVGWEGETEETEQVGCGSLPASLWLPVDDMFRDVSRMSLEANL